MRDNDDAARVRIAVALQNKDDSCLMRHELAYILGQIQDSTACGVLSDILQDTTDDVMVRHEVRSLIKHASMSAGNVCCLLTT